MALCWTRSGTSPSAFYWGAQNRGQHSSCGLISAEWGVGVGKRPLDLLARLFLMQPMDTAGHPCCKVPNRTTPRSFSAELLSQPVPVIPSQVQDCTSPFGDSCEMAVCSFLQPADIPLNSSTAIQAACHSSPFCVICKPAEGELSPSVQVINEDITQYWSQ